MKFSTRGYGTFILSGLSINADSTGASKLQWGACKDITIPQPANLQCANLTVPLDYKNESSTEMLTLDLVKVKAAIQPCKGTVLYNPGGPGLGGRNQLVASNTTLLEYTGGVYDIVSWNPRGTGNTLPGSCWANATDRSAATALPPDTTHSIASINMTWASNKRTTAACAQALAGYGDLIGTAYTARDMMQIVDALGEDGLLRYYGDSYGTALGQVAAAMFPDKVDKLVIDGVLNPHQYMDGLDYQQLSTAEAVLDGFFAACLSRPDSCLLSQRDTSVQNLRQQVNGLIKRLENSPYTFGPLPGEYVTSQLLREVISNALYGPFEWPVLAGLLYSLLEEDDTGIAEWASQLVGGAGAVALTFPDPFYPEMVPAIRCSDVAFRANDASAVVPIVDNFLGISPTFGGYLSALQSPLMCGQWPFQAKERYTGSFEVETRKPMLIVSNIFDPVTSLDAARNASATFRGSVLLTQDAYGHTSQSVPSKCAAATVAAYFVNGTLPKPGTICSPDFPVFANVTDP